MEKQKKECPIWKMILGVILAVALVFGLLYGVLFLTVMLWAKNLDAKHEKMEPQVQELASAYIAEQYPGNDFEITDLYHNFKDNSFDVKVQSRSSADTYFTIKFADDTLKVDHDSYEWSVTNRGNTVQRIVDDYNAQVKEVLEVLPGIEWARADIVRYSSNSSYSEFQLAVGLDQRTLELDKQYEAAQMGWDHGTLELRFVETDENLNIYRLLERLREVDTAMTQAGVGYRVIEIRLVNGPDWEHTREFYIHDIFREDLHSDDPMAVLQALWEEQEAIRQALKEQWAESGKK